MKLTAFLSDCPRAAGKKISDIQGPLNAAFKSCDSQSGLQLLLILFLEI
jgi:hypothetical protein